MEFLEQFFKALDSEYIIAFSLFLLIAFLIGFITAWLPWSRRAAGSEKKANKLSTSLDLLRIEQSTLKEQLELKDADLLKADREAEEAVLLASSLESERDQLKIELYAARGEIEKLKASAHSYTRTIDDLNNQILGLKTRHLQLAEEMEKEEEPLNRMDEMQSSVNASSTRLDAIEEKLEKLAGINQILKASSTEGKDKTKWVRARPSLSEQDGQEDSKENKALAARQDVKQAIGKTIPKATAGQKDDLSLIKGIGALTEKKLNELGIYSFKQIKQFDNELIEKVSLAISFFSGRIQRDDWVGQAKRLGDIKKESPEALLPSSIFPDNPEDLKVIEGIGPKIETLLKSAGIKSWKDLAETIVEKLHKILQEAGDQFRLHDPSTWPMQAQMATDGEWEKLKKYQDYLIGGKEKKD